MILQDIKNFGILNLLLDRFGKGGQFEFFKRYTKLKGSELIQNEYSYGELENAYQHAYVSAWITYKYGESATRWLGYFKEIYSKKIEIGKNGKTNAYLDTNRDLWNNEAGIKYGLNGKKQGKTIDEIADDIFNNIMKQDSDFIVNFKTDKRRWDKSSNEDNMWDIINKKHKSLPYKINKIINELKEDIKSIQQNDKPKKDVMPISYKSKNDVYNNKDEWTYEKHLAFLEGFDSGGSWQGNKSSNFLSRNNEKEDWKKKLNIGNPETDEGHWVTLKNHQHVFIKDA